MAFRRAAALLDTPVEIVQIPFEGTTLPGYFFKAADEAGVRRATVIGLGGYDGTAEEVYFYFAAPALARGYNVLHLRRPRAGRGAAAAGPADAAGLGNRDRARWSISC